MEFLISALSGEDKNLIVWNLETENITGALNGHKDSALCVDVSDDYLSAILGDKS